MLQEPSKQRPKLSLGEALNSAVDLDADVFEVGAMAASLGFFGLIWLDRELTVKRTYGWLVDFVDHSKPVTDCILPFIGLESEILSLQSYPDKVLELPAVAVAKNDGTAFKLNFTILWNSRNNAPIVLAYRSSSQSELELELSKQIRARLMAESEVTAKSKELARANADLESFAAIVSHDLKAPLRHMRILAENTAASLSDTDNAVAKTTLAEIVKQSQRLSKMLSELFDYSSIGRKRDALEIVDTKQLAESIQSRFPNTDYSISIDGTWPILSTLKAPLDLTLRNLVSNALQHHDRPDGKIWMRCTEQNSALIFSVHDDGPGISPSNHESIFLPFRTLSNASNTTSTGMGLAMVKKIVEGYGGNVSVASNPDKERGTTFTVVWPKHLDVD